MIFNRKYLAVIFVFLGILVFNYNRPDSPIDAIRSNLKASEAKDIYGVIATLDERIVRNPSSLAHVIKFFDYDLEYALEGAEVLEQGDNFARVRIVQVTREKNGGSFQDNRITAVHSLVKQDGKWKISSSKINDVEYLN